MKTSFGAKVYSFLGTRSPLNHPFKGFSPAIAPFSLILSSFLLGQSH